MRRSVITAVVSGAVLIGLASPAHAGPPYRPDGRIKEVGGLLMGNDIYNNTGVDQTVDQLGGTGDKFEYRIQGQNDGALSDRMGFNASTNDEPGYKLKFKNGSTNITSKVLGTGYKSKLLAPGDKKTIRLIVKILDGANGVHEATIEVDSIKDGDTVTDTLMAETAAE